MTLERVPKKHSPYLRDQSVDRLEDLRVEVRHLVNRRLASNPRPLSKTTFKIRESRLKAKAELAALTFVVEYFTGKITSSKDARELFERARAELSTARHFPGEYVEFSTEDRQWDAFAARFERFRDTVANGHGSKQPEYTVFGFLLAKLTDAELHDLVMQACLRVSDLKGVIAWPAGSSPSPLQS